MPNQPKTPTRTVRVGDDLWEAAKAATRTNGETITSVVVKALQQYVKKSHLTR